MSEMILWINAEADKAQPSSCDDSVVRRSGSEPSIDELPAHSFPARKDLPTQHGITNLPETRVGASLEGNAPAVTAPEEESPYDWREEKRRRATYRGRTVWMLRRYMRYSMETGRLPSVLGREFFRAKVTRQTPITFEDRVIFVHDMETCINRLDEFSRDLIARHILQEHDQAETARLLHCAERTVRTYVPMVLDLLSSILIEVGLLDDDYSSAKASCQGGKNSRFSVSTCERGRNKF